MLKKEQEKKDKENLIRKDNMKRLLMFTSIFTLLLSTFIFAEKKSWKQPQLKEGQTVQEAFDELRQNRNQKRKAVASRSEVYRGFDFPKQEKKMRRAKASESQIDRLEPRKFEINDLMDIKHENVLLGGNKNETGNNGTKK